MHSKHSGVKRARTEAAHWCERVSVSEHVHAALADTVCSYTEKGRKTESGLSVISVTLSGSLPLTNERCWQPGCILPWLCWVGRISFRAFVRFILPLLFSPCASVSSLLFFLRVSEKAMTSGQPQGHLLAFHMVTNWPWGTRCLKITLEMKRFWMGHSFPWTGNCRSSRNGTEVQRKHEKCQNVRRGKSRQGAY